MSESHLIDFMYILLFLLGGVLAALSPFVVSHLVQPPSTRHTKSLQTYECGMDPFGSAWDFRYGVSYYLYALMFLAFDVDILYLYPVAAAFNNVSGIRGVLEFSLFIGILSLALVYAWVKDVFKWPKKRTVR